MAMAITTDRKSTRLNSSHSYCRPDVFFVSLFDMSKIHSDPRSKQEAVAAIEHQQVGAGKSDHRRHGAASQEPRIPVILLTSILSGNN